MTSREWCWSRRLLVEARRKPLRPRALPGRAGVARRETRQRPEVGLWGPHPVQTARSCGAQLPPGRTEPRGGSIRAPSRNLQPQPPTRPRPPYLLKRPMPSTTSRIRLLSWAPAVRYRTPSSRGAPRAAADSAFLHRGWGLRGLHRHGRMAVTWAAPPWLRPQARQRH